MSVQHAVFTRQPRERITAWGTFEQSTEAYYRGDRSVDRVVRSSVDPEWCGAEFRQPAAQPAKYVKLTRDERERLLNVGRCAGCLEAAKDAMFDDLAADARFEHLDAEVLSDYAWSAAKFCYPREFAQDWR